MPDARDDTTVHNGDSRSGPAAGEQVTDSLDRIAGQLTQLIDQGAAGHARAEARERVIDHLHAEVERLRVGEQGLLLRPVITDLQSLRTDLLRQAETLPAQVDAAQVRELLESFALSAEQALERCGTLPVRPAAGDKYSAREHSAVRVVDAETEEEHETIVEVVSDGYLDTRTGRVTVPARVSVRRWNQVAGNQEEPGD